VKMEKINADLTQIAIDLGSLKLEFTEMDQLEESLGNCMIVVNDLRRKKKEAEHQREKRLRERTEVIPGDFHQVSFGFFDEKYDEILGKQCGAISVAFALELH
jgi:hypothetical protein